MDKRAADQEQLAGFDVYRSGDSAAEAGEHNSDSHVSMSGVRIP
jgi:hypothetical protein